MNRIGKVSRFIRLATAFFVLTFGLAGCNKGSQDNAAQNPNPPAQTDQSQDPAAAANLAPTDTTQATNTNQQQPAATQPAQQTNQQPASQPAQPAPSDQNYQQPAPAQDQNSSDNGYDTADQDTNYGQPVLQAQQPPPPLPEYSQPDLPGPRLYLDSRILELCSSGLLLGARRVDAAASGRLSVDPGILGVRQRQISLPLRILGPAHRLLRRH